jgi:hypothetical protein
MFAKTANFKRIKSPETGKYLLSDPNVGTADWGSISAEMCRVETATDNCIFVVRVLLPNLHPSGYSGV